MNLSDLKESIKKFVVERVLRPQWIRATGSGENDSRKMGDFGIRILGINLFYYKDSEPMISESYTWRPVENREFGDTIQPTEKVTYRSPFWPN